MIEIFQNTLVPRPEDHEAFLIKVMIYLKIKFCNYQCNIGTCFNSILFIQCVQLQTIRHFTNFD